MAFELSCLAHLRSVPCSDKWQELAFGRRNRHFHRCEPTLPKWSWCHVCVRSLGHPGLTPACSCCPFCFRKRQRCTNPERPLAAHWSTYQPTPYSHVWWYHRQLWQRWCRANTCDWGPCSALDLASHTTPDSLPGSATRSWLEDLEHALIQLALHLD